MTERDTEGKALDLRLITRNEKHGYGFVRRV